jgi:hypothetical protein
MQEWTEIRIAEDAEDLSGEGWTLLLLRGPREIFARLQAAPAVAETDAPWGRPPRSAPEPDQPFVQHMELMTPLRLQEQGQ